MVDGDGNHRQTMLFIQAVEHFINAPFTGIAGRGVEYILPVHEVHDRITAVLAVGIIRRQVHAHGAVNAQRRQRQAEGFETLQFGHRCGARLCLRRLLAHEQKGNGSSNQCAGQQANKGVAQCGGFHGLI